MWFGPGNHLYPRGNNVTYTFDVPSDALDVALNRLNVYPISGLPLGGAGKIAVGIQALNVYARVSQQTTSNHQLKSFSL